MLREHKDDVVAVALLISVAAAVSYNYFTIVEYPSRDDRLELHRSIVEGAAPLSLQPSRIDPLSGDRPREFSKKPGRLVPFEGRNTLLQVP